MDGPPGRPGPESHLDLAFEALLSRVDHDGAAVDTQAKLQALIMATDELTSAPLDLDLATVLSRIAQTATRLVDAGYGAFVVLEDDGEATQLVRVGTEEPHSDVFLEVPIRIHGVAFGNLRLADAKTGAFTAADAELVGTLAATAGVLISNAQLYQDVAYRGTWSSAFVETARILMAGEDDPIEQLLETVRALASADLVCVAQPEPGADHTMVTHAVGLGRNAAIGLTFPTAGSLAETAIGQGAAVAVDDLHAHATHARVEHLLGHTLIVPFTIGEATSGVLSLARTREHPEFDARDTEMAQSVAAHIGMVMAQETTRGAQRRLAALEERERIASDLHDHVIQQLYASGLSLNAIANRLTDRVAAQQVLAQVAEIDGAISQIRQTILTIRTPSQQAGDSVRSRVLEIVDAAAAGFDAAPTAAFHGPVALLTDPDLVDDLAAVVREGLANAVRHGHARTASVVVGTADGSVSVTVIDDGIGVGDSPRLSGLANLRRRAERRGGRSRCGRAPLAEPCSTGRSRRSGPCGVAVANH